MTDDEALQLAQEAAMAWGGCPAPRLIKNRENAVFDVALPSGRAALRLHRRGYQTEDAIRSELWWCAALADAGVAVAHPLAAADKDLLVHLTDGRIASVIQWVDGVALGEASVPLPHPAAEQATLHHALGALVARVHIATDRLHLPPSFSRPRWDIDGLVGDTPFWGRFWDHPGLTPDQAALFRDARAFVRDRLADHAASGGDQGLIHADVLRENVMVKDGAMTLIDFDDSGFGFRLFDLGTALSQNLYEPHLAAIHDALIAGYDSERPLGPEDIAMVPVFTLMRTLASVGWTIPRHAPDEPVVRRHIDRAAMLSARMLSGQGLPF
jgi:Ser/Thr protein kinase RdoA (MazF antagonist)